MVFPSLPVRTAPRLVRQPVTDHAFAQPRKVNCCVNISPVLVFAVMEGYITTTEAAERLGVSSARVRQLVSSGALPAQKFGPVNMVRVADLELVKNRPSVGRPPSKK